MAITAPNSAPWLQSYVWDNSSRLTNITTAAGVFSYTYIGGSDQVSHLSEPGNGYDEIHSYDGLGRVYSLAWNNQQQLAYSYDQGSQRTQQVFGVSHHMNYTYDNIGQLKSAQGFEFDGTNRLHEQFGYAYDKAWNLNYRTNNALVQAFTVNNLNEISNVTRSGTLTVSGSTTESPSSGHTEYQVTSVNVSGTGLGSGQANLYSDGTWAMQGATLANGVNTYTAVAQDNAGRQDTSTVTVNLPATNTCAYDLNGNLRTNGTRIFDYDDENQLIRITEPNLWKSEFTYDGMMRRRITKDFTWSGGAWLQTNELRYVYDGRLVVQERDANNLPVVSYTRGLDLSSSLDGAGGIGGLLARTDHHLLTVGDPNAHAYYHADANGNITALMNNNGLLLASYTYDPFGNMLSMSGPLADANAYRFSSKEVGRNSGLYYYGFRFYDANSQRWLNRDPIGERGGTNLFAYVANEPLRRRDPLGLCGGWGSAGNYGVPGGYYTWAGGDLASTQTPQEVNFQRSFLVGIGIGGVAVGAAATSAYLGALLAEAEAEQATAASFAAIDAAAAAQTDAMAAQATVGELLDQGAVGTEEFTKAFRRFQKSRRRRPSIGKGRRRSQSSCPRGKSSCSR
jgi:RHS repeat-associated protein